MRDDLIERLRGNGSQWAPLMREAAEEIERLREALSWMTNCPQGELHTYTESSERTDAYNNALKVLGELEG